MELDRGFIELFAIILGSPIIAAIVALISTKWASGKALETANKALDACNTAKSACMDLIHTLQDEITTLKTAVFTAESRIAGLESDREAREGHNAR